MANSNQNIIEPLVDDVVSGDEEVLSDSDELNDSENEYLKKKIGNLTLRKYNMINLYVRIDYQPLLSTLFLIGKQEQQEILRMAGKEAKKAKRANVRSLSIVACIRYTLKAMQSDPSIKLFTLEDFIDDARRDNL